MLLFFLVSDNYYGFVLYLRVGLGFFLFFSIVLNNNIKIILIGSKGWVLIDYVRWGVRDCDKYLYY